jgi:D-aminopeptidase
MQVYVSVDIEGIAGVVPDDKTDPTEAAMRESITGSARS